MENSDYYSPSLEQVFDRFEVAWITAAVPVLSEYLPFGLSVEEQRLVLLELVLIDLEYRWKRFSSEDSMTTSETSQNTTLISGLARFPLLEDYCQMFPELGPLQHLTLEAVIHEYHARSRAGHSPNPKDYLQRFPHLTEELARELSLTADISRPSAHSSQGLASPGAPDIPATNGVPHDRNSGELDFVTQIEGHNRPTETLSLQTIHPWKHPSARPSETDAPFQNQSTTFLRPRAVHFSESERLETCDYEVGPILGEGGMGAVFRARQGGIDRDVAMKMIKARSRSGVFGPESIEKFLAEAVITGALEHPNVIPIYDVGLTSRGEPFYVMKEVHGNVWSRTIDSASEDDNLNTLLRVADAIGFAHARGVVHRDLKPDNIMLGEFGEVLVLDWGLAFPTPKFKNARIAFAKGLAGTPAYMAPEMAVEYSGKLGPLSDVYLLGALLFRCLTGKPPHAGRTVTECLKSAERNDIVATDRNDELMQIARKAMASQPEARYQSAGEFQQVLREYRSHAESHRLTEFARLELKTAKESTDYRRFEKAVLGLEQAVELWSGNHSARESLVTARIEYAWTAFDRHDYELAEQQLDTKQPLHAELLPRIRQAKEERDARVFRLRRMKTLATALAVVVLLAVSIAALLINRSRKQELLAKNEAVLRFQQSQLAIERITSISDQIRHLPRLQAVRQNLLKMVASYYQELTGTSSNNPVMQLELARSLVRLGDVHSQLAQHRDAIQSWTEAMRFAERLRHSDVANEAVFLVRQAKLRMVPSFIALHQFPEARGLLTDLQEELVKTGASANSELAQVLFQRGLLLREMGQDAPSIESLLEAETTYRLVAKTDSSAVIQRGLATTLSTLGQLLQRNGEADKATTKIEQAGAIWSDLAEQDPSNPDMREGFATCQIDLANALRGSGHEPMAAYSQAIAAYEELVRARPEIPQYEFNLAAVRINLASLLNRRGETEQAKTLAVDGINGFIRLVNEYPEDVRYQDREVEARITLAEVLRDRDEIDLAVAMLSQATDSLDQKRAKDDLPQYLEQTALAASLRGQIATPEDNPQTRRQFFQTAVAAWDRLLEQDASQAARYQDSAAWTRFHFATLLWESGDVAEAGTQIDAAIRLRETLPANAVWDESFAWLLLHNPDSDKRDLPRALILAQRAANAANDNPRLWHTLTLAQLRNQRFDDCQKSLHRAQEIGSDPSGERHFLESLLAARNDHERARTHYHQGDEQMQMTAPSSPRLKILKVEAASALKMDSKN